VEQEVGDVSIAEKNCGTKARVSFGTNMTTDEESSDGNSVVKTELELAMVVERFHARKFGAKLEKRGELKVNCTGAAKKQKTSIKSGMQGVLRGLDKDEMDEMLLLTKYELVELMEVSTSKPNGALKLEPQNLVRPIRINEYTLLELPGLGTTSDSSRTGVPSAHCKSQNSVHFGD
jgi:hypothetical protein